MNDDDKKLQVSTVADDGSDSGSAAAPERPEALDAEQSRAAFAAAKARRAAALAALEAARAGTLRLNALESPPRKSPKRVGRGIGSGTGKTSGRGHKGARSRSGARRGRAVFEGGQTPLQRRLPKRGFVSRLALTTARIRLGEIAKIPAAEAEVDLTVLKKHGLAPKNAKRARVFLSGEISRKVVLNGIPATAGARAAIEKAGGKIVLAEPKPDAKAQAKAKARAKRVAANATSPGPTGQAPTGPSPAPSGSVPAPANPNPEAKAKVKAEAKTE